MTSTVAARNAQIKKTLARAFPGSTVTVRGALGDAYAGTLAHVDFTPRDAAQAELLTGLAYQHLAAAQIDVGSRYTDDTWQEIVPEMTVCFNQA